MSVTATVNHLIKQLTPEALDSVRTILEAAVASGNPARYLKRLAIAEASKVAAKKTAATALAATKSK